MPSPSEAPEIKSVFLSATARDCEAYRLDIVRAVETIAVRITLQEKWAGPAEFVVDKCRRKLTDCDGYFGLFGYRYGWIPDNFEQSITELEFLWATDHWTGHTPPIFIFLPRAGSAAEALLREEAEKILCDEYPDAAGRAAIKQKQVDFKARVSAWAAKDGRLLNQFSDLVELVAGTISSIHHWNQRVIRDAPDTRHAATGSIPEAELGAIGRDAQTLALRRGRKALQAATAPAASLLVHGPENWGQRQFAQYLGAWGEGEEMQVLSGQPTYDEGAGALIRWVSSWLKVPVLDAPDIGQLAELLLRRLDEAPLLVVLHSLGRQPERLRGFRVSFWQPLLEAMARRPRAPDAHRLLWVVIDHAPLPDAPGDEVWTAPPAGGAVDYSRLLPLPALDAISDEQVEDWLAHTCKELAGPRRRAIAAEATQPDGLPANVYNRLALNGFWAA